MRVSFDAQAPGNFAGVNIEEPENWGVLRTGSGYPLSGANNVILDMRSPDGATVQFGVGGCNTSFMTIPASWTTLTIALNALSCSPDLTDVHILFAIATNDIHAPQGGTVLIDNVHFDPVPSIQQSALGFPLGNQTFGVLPQQNAPILSDQVLRNLTTIYESAITEEVLLARGTDQDLADARLIADTFDYALHHDNHGDLLPIAPDGSVGLHNGYESGDIALFNDQQAPKLGKSGDIRLAGFTATVLCAPSGFCLVLDGATGGNNAFAILGLVAAYEQFGDIRYLNDAVTIGHWIVGNLTDTSGTGYGGYFVGYPDEGVPPPKPLQTGKSVENNADIFAALTALANIESQLGNSSAAASWTSAANVAGDFVMQMFDPTAGRFNAGTVPVGTSGSGICPNGPQKGNDVINTCDFLDSNTFTTLAMAGVPRYASQIDWRRPIQYVLSTFAQTVTAGGQTYEGFNIVQNPVSGANGVAWEFTGQAIEAMRYVDRLYSETQFEAAASNYLAQVAQAQSSAPFGDALGLVASTMDGGDTLPPIQQCLNTPFQCIAERVGLAATAWGILSNEKLNVFSPFPSANASPGSLTFTAEQVGITSIEQTVTLSNPGSVSLAISSIGVTGTNAGDFRETNTCGSNLAAGATCTINVTFTPTVIGARNATLTITDNVLTSPQTLSLTGTGTGAAVSLSAPPTFPSEPVGTTSAAQTITVTNTGNSNLSFTAIDITGPFTISSSGTTCSTSNPVAASGSCTVAVTFTPTSVGAASGSLSLTDNAGNSPQTVTLSGTGTGATVSLSAPPTFPSEPVGTTSPAVTVTLTNTGNASLTITAIGVTGPFAVASTGTTCSTSSPVTASGFCTVAVTFTPTSAGTASGNLSFTDNAGDSPQTLVLNGTGQDFTVAVSPSSATATPNSSANYTLTVTPVSGFAGKVALTCAGAPTGSSCAVSPSSVTPNGSAMTATATLSVSSGRAAAPKKWITWRAPGFLLHFLSPVTVGLLGLIVMVMLSLAARRQSGPPTWRGTAFLLGAVTASLLAWVACGGGGSSVSTPPLVPNAGLSPSTLTFNPQHVGSQSAPQTVTLSNSGNASLSVTTIAVAGTNAGDFNQTNNCGSSVAAGASCTIGVTFTPTTDGSRSGTLTITDNANGSPQSVSLSGTGQTTATLTFTATSGTLSHSTTASVTVQ
jgi:hypothetical protein